MLVLAETSSTTNLYGIIVAIVAIVPTTIASVAAVIQNRNQRKRDEATAVVAQAARDNSTVAAINSASTSAHTAAINKAVNSRPADEPSLYELAKSIDEKVSALDGRLGDHLSWHQRQAQREE